MKKRAEMLEMVEMSSAPRSNVRSQTLAVVNEYAIYLMDEVGSPSEYVDEFDILRNGTQNDMISIVLNNVGGDLDTALGFVNFILGCESQVTCEITGSNASAATMIMLACHDWIVYPHTVTMVHSPSGVFGGKFGDAHNQSRFYEKFIHNFYHDIYKGFLTEEEIAQVLDGKDFWFDSDETSERLERVAKLRQEEKEALEESLQEDADDAGGDMMYFGKDFKGKDVYVERSE